MISLTGVAYSQEYRRCFNEEQATRIAVELTERDFLLEEVRTLEQQISIYEQMNRDYDNLLLLTSQQRDQLNLLNERTLRLIDLSNNKNKFCDKMICKIGVTAVSIALVGISTKLVIDAVR